MACCNLFQRALQHLIAVPTYVFRDSEEEDKLEVTVDDPVEPDEKSATTGEGAPRVPVAVDELEDEAELKGREE